MEKNIEWISVSLFSEVKNWNLLLQKGIKPFIKSLVNGQLITYQVSFNNDLGPNIRLSLLTEDQIKPRLVEEITIYFNTFFLSVSNINEISVGETSDSQYLPNTVVFGLYDLNFDNELLETQYPFEEVLSKIIIDGLGEDVIDVETKLTFAYYLNIALIKVYTHYFDGGLNDLLSIYQVDLGMINQLLDVDILYKYHKQNKKILLEITNDIFAGMEKDPNDDIPEWLKTWSITCDKIIKQRVATGMLQPPQNEKVKIIHEELKKIVNDHLNISGYPEFQLSFMINQTLGIFFENGITDIYAGFVENRRKLILEHQIRVNKTRDFCTMITNNPIPKGMNELRLFVIARNESLRLPYFLKYYSQLGVDRFFLIDNCSTDDTIAIASAFPNLHIFKIEESYTDHWNWMEYFLNRYGKNKWCLVVDVDELLYYPCSESVTFKQLITYFELNQYTAMRSILLDIYSDKPIDETYYRQNEDPLKICPFFDTKFETGTKKSFDQKAGKYFDTVTYAGGSRGRIFKNDNKWFHEIIKNSLFKYSAKTYLTMGMHAINGAKIADIEGAVMHSKFLSDFKPRAHEESCREVHYQNAIGYKLYHQTMLKNEKITFKNDESVKFSDTLQLVELGLMKSSDCYRDFVKKLDAF